MNDDILVTKSKPVRGPNGRFISTKKIATSSPATTTTPPVPKAIHISPVTQNNIFDDLSYYGQSIRRLFKNEQWYFAIEDFFPLVQVTDPPDYVNFIKSKSFYKKLLTTDILEVPVSSDVSDTMPLIFGNKNAILELVGALREREKIFPGPFLQWVETTSQLTLKEQFERNDDREKNANVV